MSEFNVVNNQELIKKLQEPFPPSSVEWRVQRCTNVSGKPKALVLAYITSRAVMDRLDSVFGIGGWKDTYEKWGENSVTCTIHVKIDGEWISKQDGADNTQVEATKGGFSDALKRAAVKLGIGRYLYNLPETWVDITDTKRTPNDNYINDRQNNIKGYWTPPELPDWALPGGSGEPPVTPTKPASKQKTQSAPQKPTEPPQSTQEDAPKASPTLIAAIRKSLEIVANRGIDITEDAFMAEHFGGRKLDELTQPEAQDAIKKANMLLAEASSK